MICMFKVISDSLLLTEVFGNFRNTWLKIYELDPVNSLSAPGLAWQAALKKAKVKLNLLNLLTDIDILLMVEKGIRGGICHCLYLYAKGNNKCMKEYDKNKESSYIQCWDVNSLYGRAISQKPVNNFEWIKDTSKFYKNYNEENDEGFFLEVDVQYFENLHQNHNDLSFLPERINLEKA